MYPVDSTTMALFESGSRQVARITGLKNTSNVAVTITEANICQGGLIIDRSSVTGTKIEIGAAVAAKLTLKLYNWDGSLSSVVFSKGKELFVEIGTADWTSATPTVTYIPMGYFIIQKVEKTKTAINITALDRMVLFDKIANSGIPGGYVELAGSATGIPSYACNRVGVPKGTWNTLPNGTYNIKYRIANGTDDPQITCRYLVQMFARLTGTVAFIDYNGVLQFQWYSYTYDRDQQYIVDDHKRYSTSMNFIDDETVYFCGVRYFRKDGSIVQTTPPNAHTPSTAGPWLDIAYCELIKEADEATVLGNIADATCIYHRGAIQGGYADYYPFTAEICPAPWLFPTDDATIWQGEGEGEESYWSTLSNVTFKMNAHTGIGVVGGTEDETYGSLQDQIDASIIAARNLCQATGTSNTATSISAGVITKVPLVSASAISVGEGFEISDGGIKVLFAGTYKVSGSAYIHSSGNSGAYSFGVFIKSGSDFSTSTEISSGQIYVDTTGGALNAVPNAIPKLVALSADDIVYLSVRSQGGAGSYYAGNTGTWLLVERLA